MLKKLQPLLHKQLVRLSRIWLLLRKGPNLPASWLPRRKKQSLPWLKSYLLQKRRARNTTVFTSQKKLRKSRYML